MLVNDWHNTSPTTITTIALSSIDDTTTFLTDVSTQGVMKVNGDDGLRFLQGQATCDMRDITSTTSALGAFCSPQGRMFANFRALLVNNQYLLHMHKSIVATTREKLDKYSRFFKVTMTDASDDWIRFGIAGVDAETLLSSVAVLPKNDGEVTSITNGCIVKLPHHCSRFEIWLNHLQTAQTLWQQLSKQCPVAHADAWALLDIRSGIATLNDAVIDAFTPHMINYQLVKGISFTKGCYTGQEIVARTHYLGKLKRQLYRAQINSSIPPYPNTPITSNGTHVGDVINSVKLDDKGNYELLVVLQQTSVNQPLFFEQFPIHLLSLPYALE